MTYDEQNRSLDHSAGLRLTLWEDAAPLISSNPLFGTGFNTYAYMHRVGFYEDTHNYYLKALVETGLVGLTILLWFLLKTFGTAYRLSRHARDPFLASLGLGLAAWLVCAITASCFGDRWTFIQVNGYMWVMGGMVSHAFFIDTEDETDLTGDGEAGDERLEEPYAFVDARSDCVGTG